MLVGVLFGEKNAEAIDESGRFASSICIRFCGTVCILFFVFARPVARLYISEGGELLNMTVFAVRMIALEAPLYGLLRLRIAYLQAVNRTRDMQLLSVLKNWL